MMKKLLALMAACAFVLNPFLVLAESNVTAPALPTNFASWPNHYKSTCENAPDRTLVEIFGRINTATNTGEFVERLTNQHDGKPLVVLHANGPSGPNVFFFVYYPEDRADLTKGWKKYDMKNQKDEVLPRINVIKSDLYYECPSVEIASSYFLNMLFKKLGK